MLGVPQEDRHKLFEWSNRMIGSEDPEYIVSEEEVQNAQIEMFMYANELAAERREMPRDDIVVDAARRRGRRRHALGDGLQPLLPADRGRGQRDDAQLDLARHPARSATTPTSTRRSSNDPSLAQSATEEIVRWASPVMYFRRNVTKDTELGGQQLKEGDKVSIWYVSANRDEDVFDDPFTFDIRRSPNEHVGFGGGGPHHCLGANLARMEIYVLLEEMARRIPTHRARRRGAAAALQLHRRHQAHAREVPEGPPRELTTSNRREFGHTTATDAGSLLFGCGGTLPR